MRPLGLVTVALALTATAPTSAAQTLASAAPTRSAARAEPDLTAVRLATARFRDVRVAEGEGYVRDPGNLCDSAEMMGQPAALGAMGIHYARPDLLGITRPPAPRVAGTGTHSDFRRPAILIYEPQADGSLELVAVENLVFRDAENLVFRDVWHAAGSRERPSYLGVPYDRMVDDPATPVDEAHLFEPHYDRRVWLYRENPNGVFATFNPNVSCRHHKGPATHKH